MRKPVALVLGILVALLGLAEVGQAQSTVQVQGTIQSVDCASKTLVVATPDGVHTIMVAPYTTVLVDSRPSSLCDLQRYAGSPASVWLVASGNQFVATRIEASGQYGGAPSGPGPVAQPAQYGPGPSAQPAPYGPPPVAQPVPVGVPVQDETLAPLPIAGVVLGTILIAGLVYLLVRDAEGYYWRYPYYGQYYRHYYRPYYRPYYGWYPPLCPIVFAAAPIIGFVLGVAIFGGLNYLIVRDYGGHYVRYPYYGPYRTYYYRPEYRSYTGTYRGDWPVRYGDTRGNTNYHGTATPGTWTAPYQTPYQRPNYTPAPSRPNDNWRGPGQTPYGAPAQYQGGQGGHGRYNRQDCRSDKSGGCSDGRTNR